MSKFRLALVRQKYRPDGGAERFVSRALEALDASDLELNVITREWQGPVKPSIWCKAMSASPAATCTVPETACIVAGYSSARAFCPAGKAACCLLTATIAM